MIDSYFLLPVAQELSISPRSVTAVIQLLNEGNTIPFIARYRKEVTGNLDEVQIKSIQERYSYLRELEERRQAIISSIDSQGKLTDALKQQILSCSIKNELEDLYLPYKPKRRTRAAIAREKGLELLADFILSQRPDADPLSEAMKFINLEKGVTDLASALQGARDILAEKIAENAQIRALLRTAFVENGFIVSKGIKGKINGPTKFEQYYDFKERVATIPSHRYLAIRRGEREEILDFSIELEADPILHQIAQLVGVNPSSLCATELQKAIEESYKRLLFPSVETDIRLMLKEASDRAAVDIFASNLRHLLLASPLGGKKVIGIDPGLRTGCKCAAVDGTGKFLETITIYPSQGQKGEIQAEEALKSFILKHQPDAVGIGNGTAGRETETFVRKLIKNHQLQDVLVISVNESGASVYSASDVAREEFPDIDLTIRGAISIARRLQDPLAELVKIDPKSIGVGQYQHDVHQPLLQDQLHHVVESCVNHVGVDLNTASASLLSYVSGIGESLAKKIVRYRDQKGAFGSRSELTQIPGFGAKTFEQSAGFLRIPNSLNPLDASAVHPERYGLVEKIANDLGVPLIQLLRKQELISKIQLKNYVNESVGEATLKDIIEELQKPGRDPRAQFEPPCFRDDVLSIQDLKLGMVLEGIVTNVTAFGAFVDIGVHQDGLIHLSELSEKYIKHPSEVVSAGDKIKVEVVQIDLERKRIGLSARIGLQKKTQNQSIRVVDERKNVSKQSRPVNKEGFSVNPFANL